MIFRGFAPPTSDLTKELIHSRIQQQMTKTQRQDVILGTSALLQRRTALIAEITNGKVLQHVAEHLQEGILLSPNKLLLLPGPPWRTSWPRRMRPIAS